MKGFRKESGALIWEMNHETVVVQPWGRDSLRVRSTRGTAISDTPWALLPPAASAGKIEFGDSGAVILGSLMAAASTKWPRSSGKGSPEEWPYAVLVTQGTEQRSRVSGLGGVQLLHGRGAHRQWRD